MPDWNEFAMERWKARVARLVDHVLGIAGIAGLVGIVVFLIAIRGDISGEPPPCDPRIAPGSVCGPTSHTR